MTRRWLLSAGPLAALVALTVPAPASAQHWLAYYPGGVQNWYFGPHPFVSPWQNVHWPSTTSYFTYGLGEGTYKVYHPTEEPNGKYYYTTPKAGVPYQETTARIEVKVPFGDTDLWFEGQRTTRGGLTRHFRSPPLASNRTYKYDVFVIWREDGREVKQNRTVTVRAGDRISIDFAATGEGETLPEPKKPGL